MVDQAALRALIPTGPRREPLPRRGPLRHPGLMPAALRFTGEDKDLTLDELAEFVDAARKAGVPGDNPVRAELSTS